jgi:hypothetical protein
MCAEEAQSEDLRAQYKRLRPEAAAAKPAPAPTIHSVEDDDAFESDDRPITISKPASTSVSAASTSTSSSSAAVIQPSIARVAPASATSKSVVDLTDDCDEPPPQPEVALPLALSESAAAVRPAPIESNAPVEVLAPSAISSASAAASASVVLTDAAPAPAAAPAPSAVAAEPIAPVSSASIAPSNGAVVIDAAASKPSAPVKLKPPKASSKKAASKSSSSTKQQKAEAAALKKKQAAEAGAVRSASLTTFFKPSDSTASSPSKLPDLSVAQSLPNPCTLQALAALSPTDLDALFSDPSELLRAAQNKALSAVKADAVCVVVLPSAVILLS